MSNQDRLLRDDELRKAIDEAGGGLYHYEVDAIVQIFHTQKRLYAESVIGEDYKKNTGWGSGQTGFEYARKTKDGRMLTSELTAIAVNTEHREQRASIYKQNADDFRRIK